MEEKVKVWLDTRLEPIVIEMFDHVDKSILEQEVASFERDEEHLLLILTVDERSALSGRTLVFPISEMMLTEDYVEELFFKIPPGSIEELDPYGLATAVIGTKGTAKNRTYCW